MFPVKIFCGEEEYGKCCPLLKNYNGRRSRTVRYKSGIVLSINAKTVSSGGFEISLSNVIIGALPLMYRETIVV